MTSTFTRGVIKELFGPARAHNGGHSWLHCRVTFILSLLQVRVGYLHITAL